MKCWSGRVNHSYVLRCQMIDQDIISEYSRPSIFSKLNFNLYRFHLPQKQLITILKAPMEILDRKKSYLCVTINKIQNNIKRGKKHVNSIICLLHPISLSLTISPTTHIFTTQVMILWLKLIYFLLWYYLSNLQDFGWAILSDLWLHFFQAFLSLGSFQV